MTGVITWAIARAGERGSSFLDVSTSVAALIHWVKLHGCYRHQIVRQQDAQAPCVTTTGSATSTQCIKPVMLLLLICFDAFLKFLAPDRDREAELKRAALA